MRTRRVWWLLLMLAWCGRAMWADGPHIAFHGTEGAYTVTLFSAPDPLVAGPADLNLMVQKADDGSLVSSAEAWGELTLPGHAPVRFQFTPGGASNRQLPGARVMLPDAGAYGLGIEVRVAGVPLLHYAGTLPVAVNDGKRNTVVWAVALPMLLILLFLVNQYAKGELGKRGRHLPV